MLEIIAVAPGSTAARMGLREGDSVRFINRTPVRDVIDYQFLAAEEHITITLQTREGQSRTISLDKEPDDTLGLEFAPLTITQCRNNCIFCFVRQMPKGCRKSLYVKDDDFRASFLYGNYMTLGALTERDWQRIFDQRLSPLYISVHATDPSLRSFMIGNKKAPDIMAGLRRLAAGGARMHTQIVLCPGLNDGLHLQKTLADLSGLFPAVISVAVVPVGLTSYRKGLYPLRTFSPREARAVIDEVTKFGTRFKKQHGTRLVFPSDEFYIKAGQPVPPPSYYEDFAQIENGVGMVADFLRTAARTSLPGKVKTLRATLVTGVSFSKVLKGAIARTKSIEGLTLHQVTVRNNFFGPSVTVAGLLTGSDIAAALSGKRLGDLVVVPAEALRAEDSLFLDGMSLDQLRRRIGTRIVAASSFRDLIASLKSEGGPG